jgi:hypothetical protein
MRPISILTSLVLISSFYCCETKKAQSFIKKKKARTIVLSNPPAPHVLFLLKSGDTLKFSSQDIVSLLEMQIRNEIKRQGYLSSKSSEYLSKALRQTTRDTLIIQSRSAVSEETIGGTLDLWVARELLLKGKVEVAIKDAINKPIKLKYVFIKDNLGNQQGTFFTKESRKVYWTIISLGE